MGKRKKRTGHFCWVCERPRPNERFSGDGHRRHVCRDCAHLGGDELAYRQAVRNLGRCITIAGGVRRKRRTEFERFLHHPDLRGRAMAEALEQRRIENRERSLAEERADEEAWSDVLESEASHDDATPIHIGLDDEIPY